MAREAGHQISRRVGTIQEYELKVCDLCSSLNLVSNESCFVCGWTGHFESSHEVVRTAVVIAVQRHGPLELEYLTDIETYREPAPSLTRRVRAWVEHLWKWLLG